MPGKKIDLPPSDSQKVVESLFQTITKGVKDLRAALAHPSPHKEEPKAKAKAKRRSPMDDWESASDRDEPKRAASKTKMRPTEHVEKFGTAPKRRYVKKQAPR